MKPLLVSIALFISFSASAQIDLSKDPGKPVIPPKKSNAQLLKESQQPVQQSTDTNLSDKYKAKGMVVSPNGNQYNENGKMGSQSQQYNMGNGTKATNTINYDNSGKVQGSSTTIEFGKKKK
jgi:hypothetical protein